jgi:hypothetical protein
VALYLVKHKDNFTSYLTFYFFGNWITTTYSTKKVLVSKILSTQTTCRLSF